jgi:DNA-binding transcriptional regulator YiaG
MTDADFTNTVIKHLQKESAGDFANRLRVSRSTVIMWSRGNNLPHEAIRPAILSAIKEY